jgi:hypothetical protein
VTTGALANRQKKGHRPKTMPCGFAGDLAPQQLTAPCRKYSGRLHTHIEQVVYRLVLLRFLRFGFLLRRHNCEPNYISDLALTPALLP